MSAALEMSASAVSARSTENDHLDQALTVLADHAAKWARLGIDEKIRLLEQAMDGVENAAEDWARAGTKAKGLPPGHGEEWLAGPVPTLRNLRLLKETLERIKKTGSAVEPSRVKSGRGGRTEVAVFPVDAIDGALFAGFTLTQRMQEGLSTGDVVGQAGSFYKKENAEGGVSLILGAGNVSSIPPMDALYKLYAEGYVCIIKMNPVNEWVGPILERAFKAFVDAGFLRVVYGGAEVGKYLVEHDTVVDIHITGSNITHDMIVWGPPGPERERRLKENDPVLKKRITSELGNVSPVAIVPGNYTDSELDFMAKNVAAMVTNNASFNCNAAKMLITAKGWKQRDSFVEALSRNLASTPTRKAYYPGAQDRYNKLTEGRDKLLKFGDAAKDELPWTVIPNLDASSDDVAFTVEPFCGVISETRLDADDPVKFLEAATDFMNNKLWGTLNAGLMIAPESEKRPEVKEALESAIDDLCYGSVTVNHWAALCYATVSCGWGGHPSATLQDVQSGLGWVHNTFLLEGLEKTILRGPLKVFPKPVWFADHKKVAEMGKKLVSMEKNPSWLKVPGLVVNALQG